MELTCSVNSFSAGTSTWMNTSHTRKIDVATWSAVCGPVERLPFHVADVNVGFTLIIIASVGLLLCVNVMTVFK